VDQQNEKNVEIKSETEKECNWTTYEWVFMLSCFFRIFNYRSGEIARVFCCFYL
jgi:hypothetical protein